MIKEERLNIILSILLKDQKVLLSNLSQQLQVSEDTIRRDIKTLSDQGLLKAVRGGAVSHSTAPRHFRAREHYDQPSKDMIAAKALNLLENDQVIVFDGGTSTLTVAASIPRDLKITVVTNSFPIAAVLEDHAYVEVIFAGGRLNKTSYTAMGQDTLATFSKIRADLCFFGVCSIHPTIGVTTVNYEQAEIKRAMVESSKRTIALATYEKINKADAYLVCPVTAIDTIITNKPADQADLVEFLEAGVHLL